MLSVEDALERILGNFHVLEVEDTPILDALGQVLAEDVVAKHDIPPLDNSAMDGYAVIASSLEAASPESPAVLRVIGSVAAGELPKEVVRPGTAIRIMTGAPIPPGADAVVPFEDSDEIERRRSGGNPDEIAIRTEVQRGADVRPAGQDVRNGQKVLERGTVLRPSEIGVLASLGSDRVKAVRKPVVAVLSTGNELLEPGEEHGYGKIYDSNSYSVAASVARYGGIPRLLGIARDNLESMNEKLRQGLGSDMLVTSAGVSKGDYDMVKDVLAQNGEIDFWSVRMRPAKPLAFGVLDAPGGRKVPLLGLPGNPVSAMVAFEQFGRAAIFKMLGKTGFEKPVIQAVLDDPIYNTDGRRVFARAVVTRRDGNYHAKLTGNQSSNLLTSMARANGLAICPEDLPVKEAGQVVQVQMLDWPEDVF
jgi:molybdopterin molybdotransferase